MKNLLPFIAIPAGLFFLVFGIKFFIDMWNFKKNAIKTTGVIEQVRTALSKAKETIYSPVIKFNTTDGKEIVYDVQQFRYHKYTVGDSIGVLYDRNNPSKAKIAALDAVFWGPVLAIIVGIGCIAVGLMFIVRK